MQLYSTVNSVQSDEKRLIMVNVHKGCYFFVFFSTLANLHICIFDSWMPLVNGCVNCALFNACQKFIFI